MVFWGRAESDKIELMSTLSPEENLKVENLCLIVLQCACLQQIDIRLPHLGQSLAFIQKRDPHREVGVEAISWWQNANWGLSCMCLITCNYRAQQVLKTEYNPLQLNMLYFRNQRTTLCNYVSSRSVLTVLKHSSNSRVRLAFRHATFSHRRWGKPDGYRTMSSPLFTFTLTTVCHRWAEAWRMKPKPFSAFSS